MKKKLIALMLAVSVMGAQKAMAQAEALLSIGIASAVSLTSAVLSEFKLDAPKIVEDATAYVLDSEAEVGPHLAAFIEEVRMQQGDVVASDLEIAKAVLENLKKDAQ